MKQSFLTFAAAALVLSLTSCKETPTESAEAEAVQTELPAEVTPVEVEIPAEEVDSFSTEVDTVEEVVNEDPS